MFDPSNYPRTYQLNPGTKNLITAQILAFNAVVGVFVFGFQTPDTAAWSPVLSLTLAALSFIFLGHIWSAALVAHVDRLELRGLFSRRIVLRQDIVEILKSLRYIDGQAEARLRLKDGRTIKVKTHGYAGHAFFNWLQAVWEETRVEALQDEDTGFDPALYPRSYMNLEPATRWTLTVMGLGFCAGLLCIAYDIQPNPPWMLIATAPLSLFAFLWPAWLFRTVLRLDRIEIHYGFGKRTILRSDILYIFAYHELAEGFTFQLRLKNGKSKTIQIGKAADSAFRQWFDDIPDEPETPDGPEAPDASDEPETTEPTRYPRSYRPTFFEKAASLVGCTVMCALFILLTIHIPERTGDLIFFWSVAVLLVVLVWRRWFEGLTIDADRIQVHGMFGSRTILRSDILRVFNRTYIGEEIRLRLRLKDGKTAKIKSILPADDVFKAWFKDIPYEYEPYSWNPDFGEGEDQRWKAAEHLITWVPRLSWPAWAIALWAVLYPHPYNVCIYILMAIPVLGWLSVMLSRRRLGIVANDNRFNLSPGIMLAPGIVLAFRAWKDVHLFAGWETTVGPVIIGLALVLIALAAVADRRVTRLSVALCTAGALAYAGGTVVLLNRILDKSPPRIRTLEVVAKLPPDDRHGLKLKNGQSGRIDDYRTSSQLFDIVKTGDKVCLSVYRGRFDAHYYDSPELCPDDPRRTGKAT